MKLVLDTNVYSELIHPQGSPTIRVWLAEMRGYLTFTTSVTQARDVRAQCDRVV